jgi:hypothetical protein
MFQSLLTIIRVLIVTEYSNSTICAFVQDIFIYKIVIHVKIIITHGAEHTNQFSKLLYLYYSILDDPTRPPPRKYTLYLDDIKFSVKLDVSKRNIMLHVWLFLKFCSPNRNYYEVIFDK